MTRHAVVMVSIGHRPWIQHSAETFRRYCANHGLEFVLHTDLPASFQLPARDEKKGRPNKAAYAMKTYYAWWNLLYFDRVVVVDDTCCIRPDAPNIFEQVPYGFCGYSRTNPDHARRSFETIAAFISASKESPIEFNEAEYMNSGVMVYDQTMINALSPQQIARCAPLLTAAYPHQTLSYYLVKRAGIKSHILPHVYNAFPGGSLPTRERRSISDVSRFIDGRVFIYHVSAGYEHRDQIIRDISNAFLHAEKREDHGKPAAKTKLQDA